MCSKLFTINSRTLSLPFPVNLSKSVLSVLVWSYCFTKFPIWKRLGGLEIKTNWTALFNL